MHRLKTILKIYLLILIGGFWFVAPLHAQNMERINSSQKRFEISFGGGWGIYSMTKINKHYIDEFAKEVGIFDDHIDNGPNLFGEIGYFVSPKVSVSFGINYLRGGMNHKSYRVRTDEQGNVLDSSPAYTKTSLTTTLVAPELKIRYYSPFKKMDLFVSGGTTWCLGKSALKAKFNLPEGSVLEEHRFAAQGVGLLASTGASYKLNKTISLGTEMGYRLFATSGLKDKNGKAWIVDATGRPYRMNLDFSGPFILGGLRLKL
jgi:hypothetical protein